MEYVGAYRALRELKNEKGEPLDIRISSIIGSSAGGIIGLAICCEMEPQEIVDQIGVKYLSKMVEDLTYDKPEDPVAEFCSS